jgi:hypothetical protein
METKQKFVNDIRNEMKDFYGVDLTEEQVRERIEDKDLDVFDTHERSCYIQYIAREITGMDYPCNGDSHEYSRIFWDKLKNNHKDKGYEWGL